MTRRLRGFVFAGDCASSARRTCFRQGCGGCVRLASTLGKGRPTRRGFGFRVGVMMGNPNEPVPGVPNLQGPVQQLFAGPRDAAAAAAVQAAKDKATSALSNVQQDNTELSAR